MSGRGDPASDPARVSAGALMALEGQAVRALREAPSLAERPGSTATRKRGHGHEIREIRPFAEGDEPRHIDAAATARSGSPQVRSFHEDREYSLMLIADFRRPMLWGTRGRLRSVAAAEALVLAGWKAILAGGAVGVVALTDAGPLVQAPRPRHRGMTQVAGCLARAHEGALAHRGEARSLAQDLMRAARQVPRGAGIILATGLDAPGEGLEAALAALRARGPLRLLLVEDAFETAPPDRALPVTVDGGTVDGGGAEGGAAWARFTALPAARAARAERLAFPGQEVRRLSSSSGGGP